MWNQLLSLREFRRPKKKRPEEKRNGGSEVRRIGSKEGSEVQKERKLRGSEAQKKLRGSEAEIEQNGIPNRPKRYPKSTKLSKMEAKWHPKRVKGGAPKAWKTRSRKKTPAAGKNNATFDKIADLGWFWMPFWTPGGPVGVPKSSLFHKMCAWGAKKPVLGAFQEKQQNIMDFWS